MKDFGVCSQRGGWATVGTCALFACLTLVLTGTWVSVSSSPTTTLDRDGLTAPGAAGMRVSFDPETGEVAPPTPTGLQLSKAEREMLSQSHEGLYEEITPSGAGMVHLQGRFHSAAIATIDAEGHVHTSCVNSVEAAEHACANPGNHPRPQDEWEVQ